ncbi:hypothetical protein [Methylomonas koyamae]|uniref:Uncharacterized protein n=1 Tax=Methylomonas koyamae TaxID=702114 RepID=A0A291IFH9_9GAMM|nr:hypothetical protein [Methylomonas koyamae]ATG89103.1 hypothetical protein MKLM6_0830 [Methylomonas koyamae]OAI29799.1 hypothetical protein A1356_22870 [Methylomonas koyamae]
MSYAIRQTYSNYQTGEHWTRVAKKRWKTQCGAEKAAQMFYRWVTMPDGKTRTEESDAEVILLKGKTS